MHFCCQVTLVYEWPLEGCIISSPAQILRTEGCGFFIVLIHLMLALPLFLLPSILPSIIVSH